MEYIYDGQSKLAGEVLNWTNESQSDPIEQNSNQESQFFSASFNSASVTDPANFYSLFLPQFQSVKGNAQVIITLED